MDVIGNNPLAGWLVLTVIALLATLWQLWSRQRLYATLRLEQARTETQLAATVQQLQEHKHQHFALNDELKQQAQHYQHLKEKYDRLTVLLQERQSHYQSQLALLKDNKQQLKQEFELLANEILQRKGEDFKQQSTESLLQLLQPLQAESAKTKLCHYRSSRQTDQCVAGPEKSAGQLGRTDAGKCVG